MQLDEFLAPRIENFEQEQRRDIRWLNEVIGPRQFRNIFRDIRDGQNLPLRIRQAGGLVLFYGGAVGVDISVILSQSEILFGAVTIFVVGSGSVGMDIREWERKNPRPEQLQQNPENARQNGLARFGLQPEVIPQLLQNSATSLFIDMSESIIQAVKGSEEGATNEKLTHLLKSSFYGASFR